MAFGHNVLNWESQGLMQPAVQDTIIPKVCLVGSSQINLGTDISQMSADCREVTFDKKCLPGFLPIEYGWLKNRFVDANTRLIVCWLSEFDFYREDELPVNRLDWNASPAGCARLFGLIDWPLLDVSERTRTLLQWENWNRPYNDCWGLRGEFADLWISASVPIWRDRDHFRRTLLAYWWDARKPTKLLDGKSFQGVASNDTVAKGREFLRTSVGRKRFVEINFLAFRRFVEELNQDGVELIVIEGTSHPAAMSGYDPQFRVETRGRLKAMSSELNFTYLDERQIPSFDATDFMDAVHLNQAGRDRFSRFLAKVVCAHRYTH